MPDIVEEVLQLRTDLKNARGWLDHIEETSACPDEIEALREIRAAAIAALRGDTAPMRKIYGAPEVERLGSQDDMRAAVGGIDEVIS